MIYSKKRLDFSRKVNYNTQAEHLNIVCTRRSRVVRPSAHDWKSCNTHKVFEGSNPSFSAILTKRYRCVWRKVRRINRFRAFSGPDFFFQTIDANRCFRASAPIRTGRFPFSGRCVQPVPFLNGVFPAGSCIFLKKESQRFGRRFVGPDGLRKRRLFSFQKGRWSQRLYLKAGAIMLRPYFLCTGGVT